MTITKISDEEIKVTSTTTKEEIFEKDHLLRRKEILTSELAKIEEYLKEFD